MLSDMFALGLEMDWAIPQTLVWYCWEVRHRFDPQWKWQTAWPTQSQQRIIPNKHPRAPPPTVWPWKIQRTPVWRARACQWWSHHQLQNLNALWYDEAYVVWPMSKAVPKLHQPKALWDLLWRKPFLCQKKQLLISLISNNTILSSLKISNPEKEHPASDHSKLHKGVSSRPQQKLKRLSNFLSWGKKEHTQQQLLARIEHNKTKAENHDFSRHEFAHNAYICLPHHIVKPFSKLLLINLKRLSTLTTFQWLHAKSLNGIIESLGECCMISEQA